MADLDAELLALAGGDYSSGEESISSPPKRRSSSPVRMSKPSRDSPAADMSRKGVAKTTKKARKRREYSDDEDDLVSSPSQRSESASMSHSDSEAEFAPGEDKPIFPYEKLYHDAKDKASIQAKPEIERESILAQRSEQVDRHEQDLTLRRLLATRAKEAAKTEARNKRKASAADLDDNQRKSSRQRTKLGGGRAGEANSAIAAYKKHREEKTLREEQRKSRAAAKVSDSPTNEYSDADAEAESDDEYERKHKRRSPTPPKDDPTVDLSDIQRVRVGRDNFAQVCWTPGFQETITDCYARVCLGPGRTPGVNEYRLCSIKGFDKGKPYAMTAANGKSFVTDQYIIAAHGKATRNWSFIECSMSKFTEDEWRRYRVTMANEDCKMPTRSFINTKLEKINKLINHRFTDAEISDKLKKQSTLIDMVNRTAQKKDLRAQIYQAEVKNDDALVADLEDQLANIVPMKLALNTSLNRPENTSVNKEAERLAELNRRNQRLTAENVRKAQLAEKRVYRKAEKKPEFNKLAALTAEDDLFGSGSEISRANTPVNGVTANRLVSRTASPLPPSVSGGNQEPANGEGTPRSSTPTIALRTGAGATPSTKKGLPVIRRAARDDEILATMDLGIDIDI